MVSKLMRRERMLWHNHFGPSLMTGLSLAIVAVFLDMTNSMVLLFASIGSSIAILTNTKAHHLVRLHTAIISYVVAIIISAGLFFFNKAVPLAMPINLFIVVFLITLALFLVNSFHPPAISVGLSFFMMDRSILHLLFLLVLIFVLFIVVRFITYVTYEHLSIKEFWKEFRKRF